MCTSPTRILCLQSLGLCRYPDDQSSTQPGCRGVKGGQCAGGNASPKLIPSSRFAAQLGFSSAELYLSQPLLSPYEICQSIAEELRTMRCPSIGTTPNIKFDAAELQATPRASAESKLALSLGSNTDIAHGCRLRVQLTQKRVVAYHPLREGSKRSSQEPKPQDALRCWVMLCSENAAGPAEGM